MPFFKKLNSLKDKYSNDNINLAKQWKNKREPFMIFFIKNFIKVFIYGLIVCSIPKLIRRTTLLSLDTLLAYATSAIIVVLLSWFTNESRYKKYKNKL